MRATLTSKAMLMCASAGILAAWHTTAFADEAAPAPKAEKLAAEIIVTGSRVKRDGYSAPTPETVLSKEAIAAKAPTNIADYVNELPQASASATPRVQAIVVASGSAGSNFLNLRGLGTNRTLVLLDGRRVVGGNTAGNVDANVLPSSLISRVDVVTGGASAAYGSDAVAGVTNFILDTKFTGLKGSVQGGITNYGDDKRIKAELAAGTRFADGRGHVMAAVSYSHSDGIVNNDRPWYKQQKIIPNVNYTATNGEAKNIIASNVNINNATGGGLITSGVLKGTQFLQGGTVGTFTYGTIAGGYMVGGTRSDPADQYELDNPIDQFNAFGRASYEFSPAAKLFFEGTYSKSIVNSLAFYNFNLGNLSIRSDNAYLTSLYPALAAQLSTAGQTSFSYGLNPYDIGRVNPHNQRELYRAVIGLDGELGNDWGYSSYFQYGRTDVAVDVYHDQITSRFKNAIDAVYNASGQIVCRINQTTVTDASCVPYNPFGIGVNSQAAINYVSGTSQLRQRLQQAVAAVSVHGSPFSTWAGKVSLAAGLEYRSEKVNGSNDALSQSSSFLTGNYKVTAGSYNVKEGFAEVVVPLAKNMTMAENVELNGAIRRTDYSTSGAVTTWKLGMNWVPVNGVRFRGTLSRDIRAPNLGELYQAGVTLAGQTATGGGTGATYPNASYTNFNTIQIGNTALKPEFANNMTVGVVLSPAAIPGLKLSFDYYAIKITNAIITASGQQTINYCNAGNAAMCANINATAGVITSIISRPQNVAEQRQRGFDIEGSYSRSVGEDGRVTLRSLATHYITNRVNDGIAITDYAGFNSWNSSLNVPNWRFVNSVSYDSSRMSASLTARTISGGYYDATLSASTLAPYKIPGATYLDLGASIKRQIGGHKVEFYGRIDNLLNTDPVILAAYNQPFLYAPINGGLYDILGRDFRFGVRFQM